MPSNVWRQTSLGEIARKDGYGLVDGPFGSNLPASLYTSEGIPVIRGSNLTLGSQRFIDSEFVFVSQETANRLRRSICGPNDIVFTKKGTLGQTGIIPRNHRFSTFLLSSNQMKLSVDPEVADPLFVYYYVSSSASRKKIIQDAEATGVPKTNLTYLRTFPILLPCLSEQRAIAHVLARLDDKIDLNRRMNETLEATAHGLFKSWFVDVTANGLPKGWSKGTVGEMVAIISGKRPEGRRDKSYPECDVPLYGGAGPMGFVPEPLFDEPILLTGRVGTLGIIHRIAGPCWPSDNTLVVRPFKPYAFEFLFFVLGTLDLAQLNRGSTQPLLTQTDLKNQQVTIPSEDLLQRFHSMTDTCFGAIDANNQQSRTLAILCDALLPKLLSGEVRITEHL